MALPPYQFSRLVKLLLVRYSIACLRLFVVILYCLQRFYHKVDHWGIKLHYYTNFDLHCYRDFITTLIIGVLSFTITPITTCSLAYVSEIQKCLPEAICCHITRYLDFKE